ncbi:MAG: protein kinase [Clostridia bacterium]|nr:protein kinase [Clostridia bacterium]
MFLKKGYVLHNRYEIIEKIGAGGMSIVYKAEDLHLKRKVAIKVLRDEFVEDEEFIKRFRREAESVALLNHPNIVNVYDSSVDGDINFIVMEYLNGQNLEEIISKVGKIDVNAALTILYNISEALSYAHKNGIIHRDLKTKNVVINEEGIVKVADFGIAQATSSSTISVATNAIGSVYYYSPEMAKGEECDARSDIYSLGMLGYELLTGKHAFDGDTPVQVALKQVADKTPRPSEICGCSLSVDYLIEKATEKNPKDRYQNAYELMRDIDAILDGKDITKKAPQIERDEVSNFAKILDDYNEIRASEERKEHIELAKKEQLKSLDELHKLNQIDPDDSVAAMEDGITFKYMNEAERRDIERKEKIDKILNKFKLKKEEKYEDYVAREEEPEEQKEEEDPRKRPGYISLTDLDENFYADKDESYHNEYESSKPAKKESSSKSAQELAATELFDNHDIDDKKKPIEKDTNEKVSKPEKKKKSFMDFFTIDVDEEDDFEDEKDLKLEEDKMAKGRDEYGYISKDDDKQVVKAAI